MCLCVFACMCLCVERKREKKTSGLLQHGGPGSFCKSISAPKGNLHGTIYEPKFAISVQLLGPTEETAADMNLMEQRHLVVSLLVELSTAFVLFMVSDQWQFPCIGAHTSHRVMDAFGCGRAAFV